MTFVAGSKTCPLDSGHCRPEARSNHKSNLQSSRILFLGAILPDNWYLAERGPGARSDGRGYFRHKMKPATDMQRRMRCMGTLTGVLPFPGLRPNGSTSVQ